MSEEQPEMSFGEQLLGMQGFSAARATKYRAELEKLLVQRISKSERWTMGFMGIALTIMLGIMAAGSILNRTGSTLQISTETRWALAASLMVSGWLMGAWFFWVAIRGGFSRRIGDVMAILIVLTFSGSFAFVFINLAWIVEDEATRTELLLGGGTLIACTLGCIVLTIMQRMHRQTQEKLLRIEYHLAELIENQTRSSSA